MPKNDPLKRIDNRPVKVGAIIAGGGIGGVGAGGGVTDHGALTGLADDDHLQYHNDARGDARYVPLARTVGAGAGLINGGALSGNITLDVGAGLGITVNANDVALAATVAGAGLTYASGVLAVGAGAGLTVNANDVALTTPGGLSVSSTNSASGSHTHAVTASSDVGTTPAAALLKSTAGGALTLANAVTNNANSLATFASGFAGSGWRIDYGVTAASRATIETDDLVVRGRMRVYELLIQQIRATNGSLFVSSSSKTVEVSGGANPLWTVNGSQLTLNGSNATLSVTHFVISTAQTTGATDNGTSDNRLYHGFLVGDLIRAQRVRWNGSTFAGVIQSNLEVTSVTNLYTYGAVLISGDAAAVGYDYVRLGSVSDSTRRGSVYITSDDSNAPFIDIIDGVAAHSDWGSSSVNRTRLGKLSGITDADFGGTLSGYGLYGNNVYLKGMIVVTGGNAATTTYVDTGLAGKVDDAGAANDINNNTTTINGGKITTGTITANKITTTTLAAIVANLGSVTAGSIVVGSTNKLWLNESADGTLRIGGSVKASAPFQVSAAGHLDATDATFGSLQIDSSGAYTNASSSWDVTAGYRFKQGGSNAGGLTSRYVASTLAYTALLNNLTTEGGTATSSSVDTGLYLQTAAASGKTSQAVLSAIRGTTSVSITLDNTGALSRATIKADTIQQLHSDTSTYDVWTTKNAGAINLYPQLAAANTFTNTNRFSGLTYFGGQVSVETGIAFNRSSFQQCILKFNSHASAPNDSNLGDGEFMIYVVNGTGGSYELRWRARRSSGVFAGGIIGASSCTV